MLAISHLLPARFEIDLHPRLRPLALEVQHYAIAETRVVDALADEQAGILAGAIPMPDTGRAPAGASPAG